MVGVEGRPLLDALQAASLLPAPVAQALLNAADLALEAFVMHSLKEHLAARGVTTTWRNVAGNRVFSRQGAFTVQSATTERSYVTLRDGTGPRVQVLSRVRTSSAAQSGSLHEADLAVVDTGLAHRHPRQHPDSSAVLVVIEVKNWSRPAGLGDARELLGLSTDLGIRDMPPKAVVWLLAGSATANARDLAGHAPHRIVLVENAVAVAANGIAQTQPGFDDAVEAIHRSMTAGP